MSTLLKVYKKKSHMHCRNYTPFSSPAPVAELGFFPFFFFVGWGDYDLGEGWFFFFDK